MSNPKQAGNENDRCDDLKTNGVESNSKDTQERYLEPTNDALNTRVEQQQPSSTWSRPLPPHEKKGSEYEKEISKYKKEISKYKKETQKYENEIAQYIYDTQKYKKQISEYEKKTLQYKNEKGEYEKKISQNDKQISQNEEQISEYKKKIKQLNSQQREASELAKESKRNNHELQQQNENNLETYKSELAQQQKDYVKSQSILSATITTINKTISKQKNEKKCMTMFLILSWICLPALIGMFVYVQYADCINGNVENIVRNNFNADLQKLSETIQELNGLNAELQSEKMGIEQVYKENVTLCEAKLDELENHISDLNKLHGNDMQRKNTNYNNLAEEYRMCQTKVTQINDLERDIEGISKKMKDCNVDYDYCELEKAQMVKLGETHQIEMAAKNKQLSDCYVKL